MLPRAKNHVAMDICTSINVICARPWESKEAFGVLSSPKTARNSLIPEATSRERPCRYIPEYEYLKLEIKSKSQFQALPQIPKSQTPKRKVLLELMHVSQ